LLLASAVVLGSSALAKDWPQWGGTDGRNMVADERGLPSSFEPGRREPKGRSIDLATARNVKWVTRLGSMNCSTPAVVDGRVLFGSYDNCLYCLDQADGSLKWKFETQGYVHCSPAVVAGRTFIAGCDEHLRIINVETGVEMASLPLSSYLIASPAIVEDMLYVGTYGSEVVAVDWKKAEEVWRKKTSEVEAPIHSSAAVTDDLIVVGSRDKSVTALKRQTGDRV
jgi:outer membrane protein assembly factor BamB